MRTLLVILGLLAGLTQARAQAFDPPVEPGAGADAWRARRKHTQEWRVRAELTGQAHAVVAGGKTKQGPAAFAHTIHLGKDAGLPYGPSLGLRGLIELQTPIRLLFGGNYAHAHLEGPRTHVHYKGMVLGTTRYPGDSAVRTVIDTQRAEVHVRFVIFDDDRLHLSVGTGMAWASLRIGTSGQWLGHESRRVETWFAPTINYRVSWRLFRWGTVFLESTLAVVAPTQLTAIYSESRVGMLWHLLDDRVSLITALDVFSANLESYRDRWGGKTTAGHRWEQASWDLIGGELGLQARF